MHTARVVARAAAVAARTGARAQSTAVATATAPAGGASFLDNLLFDAPVQNSLDETFAGVPDITGELAEPTSVQVSKLSNGLTVVSQDSHRGASTIGMYFKGGSRTETVPGTAFAAQQLAFKSTQKRSALKLFRDVDVFGGALAASASAETLAYTASGTRDALPALAEAVAETLTAPALEPWELQENAAWASAAAAAARAAPGAAILADVHAATFGEGSALGAPPVASGPASVDDVKAFLSAHVQGKNAVLAGVNVDHAALVEAGDLLLLGLPEGAPTKFAPVNPRGGEFITRTGAGVTSLGLGFAVAGADPKQAAALAVLQAALGDSTGYSPYVATRKNQVSALLAKEGGLPEGSSLAAHLATYSDTSLFTLHGAAPGSGTGAWVDGAVGLLKEIAGGKLTDAEVANAAKAATLAAIGPLDGIASLRTDMGTQLALHGAYVDAAGKAAALGAVKAADVQAAAKAVLAGTPGVAAIGDASGLPRFDKYLTSLL